MESVIEIKIITGNKHFICIMRKLGKNSENTFLVKFDEGFVEKIIQNQEEEKESNTSDNELKKKKT